MGGGGGKGRGGGGGGGKGEVIVLTLKHWGHWWGMGYGGRETNTWLSDHADTEATINNAIRLFLYVESFCEEQKICLNLVRRV